MGHRGFCSYIKGIIVVAFFALSYELTFMGSPMKDTFMGSPVKDTFMGSPMKDTFMGSPVKDTFMGSPAFYKVHFIILWDALELYYTDTCSNPNQPTPRHH